MISRADERKRVRALLTPEALEIVVAFERLKAMSKVAVELDIPVKRVIQTLDELNTTINAALPGRGDGIFTSDKKRKQFNAQGIRLAGLAMDQLASLDLAVDAFTGGMSVLIRCGGNCLDFVETLEKSAVADTVELRVDFTRTAALQPDRIDKGTFAIFSMLLDSPSASDFAARNTKGTAWESWNTEFITLDSEELLVLSNGPLRLRSITAPITATSLINSNVVFLATPEGSVPDRFLSPPRVHPWRRNSHVSQIPYLDVGLNALARHIGAREGTQRAMIVHGSAEFLEHKCKSVRMRDPVFTKFSSGTAESAVRAITVFAWAPSTRESEVEQDVWRQACRLWASPLIPSDTQMKVKFDDR